MDKKQEKKLNIFVTAQVDFNLKEVVESWFKSTFKKISNSPEG